MKQVRALILEDVQRDQNLLDRLLLKSERFDFIRIYTHTLAGALELIKAEEFDVIFADLKVINGSGLTLLTRLHAVSDAGIICITGSMEEGERDVVQAHCNAIIIKGALTLEQIERETGHIITDAELKSLRAQVRTPSRWRRFFVEAIPELFAKVVKILTGGH